MATLKPTKQTQPEPNTDEKIPPSNTFDKSQKDAKKPKSEAKNDKDKEKEKLSEVVDGIQKKI